MDAKSEFRNKGHGIEVKSPERKGPCPKFETNILYKYIYIKRINIAY
jgi:hypothetical protein